MGPIPTGPTAEAQGWTDARVTGHRSLNVSLFRQESAGPWPLPCVSPPNHQEALPSSRTSWASLAPGGFRLRGAGQEGIQGWGQGQAMSGPDSRRFTSW